jgi:hypothetical protein
MAITTNPTIDFKSQQPSLYYYNDGACIGACIGSPEGAIIAGYGAILIDVQTGNAYIKQSASGNTGWVLLSTGGGSSPGGNDKEVQYNDAGSFGGAAGFEFDPTAPWAVSLKPVAAQMGQVIFQDGSTPPSSLAGSPALLHLHAGGSSYWALGYSRDGVLGSWANWVNSDGALTFETDIGATGKFYLYPEGLQFFSASPTYYGLIYESGNDQFSLGLTINNPTSGQFPVLTWTDTNVRLGTPGVRTISLTLSSSGSANTQTIQAADTPASSLTFKLPSADPTAGQAIVASAPSGGIVTLSYADVITGSLTTPRIPYMGGASALVDTANLTWQNALNAVQVIGSFGTSGFWATDNASPATIGIYAPGSAAIQRTSNVAGNAPTIQFKRVRASSDWPDSGDSLGIFDWQTSDGISTGNPARLNVVATENHSGAAQGSSFTLSLTPNGTTTKTDRLTINGSGEWNLRGLMGFRNGAAFTPTAPVHVVCNSSSNEGIFVDSNDRTVQGAVFSDGTNLYIGAITDDEVNLIANGTSNIRFTKDTLGFFGVTPVVRQTMGAATAGASYTATEQAMLQAVYDAVRNLGLGT